MPMRWREKTEGSGDRAPATTGAARRLTTATDRPSGDPGTAASTSCRCSQHLVRWEIEATTASGPYTLSTCFPSGRLVQVFDRASAALARQAEVQEMLVLHAQRSFLTNRRYGDGRRHL